MKRSMLCTVMMAVFLLFSGVSCKKDTEFSETVLLPEEEVIIDVENTIVIPENFDWSNIPADYKDAVWNIQFDFDLNAATIILPEGVTLYFTGGSLSNGTVTGDGTSTIVSKTKYQVFEGIDLAGTFVEEQYLMPYWFGAVMNGITDDRDVFVETLAQAHAVTARVMVDKDIFLDVEQTGTKSIFLEDNTWIEGKNDANIIINNLLSPAFYMALVKDITITNITFLYDNSYDASYDWSKSNDITLNQLQLRQYLNSTKDVIFDECNPIFRGSTSDRAMFSLEACENILFENVDIISKGSTADTFIQFVIKFKEQYVSNQTTSGEKNGVTAIPNNIIIRNLSIDGALMGLQGNVSNLVINKLDAYRYSDMQNSDGSNLGGNVGGNIYRFPPPHLMYFNDDFSINNHYPNNIDLRNITDHGEYVGTNVTRGESGYCHSLKMIGKVENVLVDNYKSYRRDGLGDFGDITNAVFKNIYAENTSEIFDPILKFSSLRFVGPLANTTFENITIKDNSAIAKIYPMDYAIGNYVTYDNIQVFVKELNTDDGGFFGILGSNNTIVNSGLTIEKHTSSQLNRGLIYHDQETLLNGANNHYEVTVNGWRTIDDNYREENCRILFANAENTNTNYAKVIDVDNNYIIEQINNVQQDQWTRTEVVDLGNGSSQKLEINIPRGLRVMNVTANTLESLGTGVEVTIGTSTLLKDNLMGNVSKTSGLVTKLVNEVIADSGDRTVYLFGNNNFQNTGKIEVVLELVRGTEY
ncbi:hypothetical protein [Cellulophaga baltica]|uniref:hypothetical protein n=1 Tax=Cellulophaga baltica TaxID=76594 RepID=UPI0015F66FB6|nr:hypothetical protein [Cellulophaga baltica]MBA6315450.1 hypothetical protein [Cellulophaga baltica]